MPQKNKKYVIKKQGYYLTDEYGQVITNDLGEIVLFKEKEKAEEFLKEKEINGKVK